MLELTYTIILSLVLLYLVGNAQQEETQTMTDDLENADEVYAIGADVYPACSINKDNYLTQEQVAEYVVPLTVTYTLDDGYFVQDASGNVKDELVEEVVAWVSESEVERIERELNDSVDYYSMSIRELKRLASERKLKGYGKLVKADLVKALCAT